jgi:hypothetical protein
VINLSDRILVSQRGRIVQEFRPAEATAERMMSTVTFHAWKAKFGGLEGLGGQAPEGD